MQRDSRLGYLGNPPLDKKHLSLQNNKKPTIFDKKFTLYQTNTPNYGCIGLTTSDIYTSLQKLYQEVVKINTNMLDKFYSTKSAKDLKSLQKLYTALLIVAISLLIIFNVISYFLSSNFQKIPSILFIIIIFWSALKVDYLKKKV